MIHDSRASLAGLARVAIAVATVACAATPESTVDSGDVEIPGSTLRVGTDSIAISPVRRIGQLDGPPEYAFGRIDGIATTRDGGFYLCDGNDVSVRRYDAAGAFLGSVGRKGAGPGEFASCSDLALDQGERLAVSDPANGRVTFFGPDGRFDHSVPVQVFPGTGGGNSFFIDSVGRMWKRGWLASEGMSEATIPHQWVILDAQGARVDSVPVPSPGTGPGWGFMLCTNDGCYSSQPHDTLSATSLGGVIAVASPRHYRIQLRHRDGSMSEIARAADPVAYTSDEHAEWEAWRAYMAKRPGRPPSPIPAEKPILRDLRFDDLGRLWVQVHVEAEQRPIPSRPSGDPRPLLTWRERNTYDLFDVASGGYIGRIAFPYATIFLTSRGDRVWLREEGESGELLVGIHEMRPVRAP